MISVEQALKIVIKNSSITEQTELKTVSNALGYALSNDIISQISMPPFQQSAMDGYAIHFHDSLIYKIVGEIKAGDKNQPELQKGEAVRIFTGAPVPNSSNCVVIQENTSVNENLLTLDSEVQLMANIRPLGEQISKNDVALKKGSLLTPASIAFLTSLGITEVKVHKKPSIAIIVTGNELIEPGQLLEYGQIYESNAIMISSALKSQGFNDTNIYKVKDDYNDTVDILKSSIAHHDLVIISGGISVGDYDFVGKALHELNVEELFYKVKQKPGKPLYFGKKDKKLIFALPGNPSAALSCFYIYVQTALNHLIGNIGFNLTRTTGISKSNYTKKGHRSQFLKAIFNNGFVMISTFWCRGKHRLRLDFHKLS